MTRELGRDGITKMVDYDRALRARELNLPEPERRIKILKPNQVIASLVARMNGRRLN